MKAMVIARTADGNTLEPHEVPRPVPGPVEVVIAVRAAGVNRADLAQRAGTYQQHATARRGEVTIAGLEVAGVIEAVGDDVTGIDVGDEVMSMCSGGYAEYVAVDHRLVLPKPERLNWPRAAATPVAFITAHNALRTTARMTPGESVLITGATSSVGLAAVQLARAWHAKPLLATAGTEAKRAYLLERGADVGINYRTEDLTDRVRAETESGVDVVIDLVGGPWLAQLMAEMAVKGRLVSVGRLAGNVGEADLDVLARKRLELLGVSFRTRTMDEYAAVVASCAKDVLDLIVDGSLDPLVARTFPLERANDAQRYMASENYLGKIVLTVDRAPY
ncbi:NAD(P)H-quinone oxidoreductase [Saccharomonospora sp. NPDC046836]|uniref:NAD(P)H-quinone oxidoreductase n=1 Tax=Saccharomonospora sp. NPDC046836 TaxID=3156921 RepID=UPI0033E01226